MIFHIADRPIGLEHPPFVIAELSGNHNQSLERAMELIDVAAEAGAHAVKLQTYTADTLTLDVDNEYFTINDPKSLWNGRRLYELYREAHTPWEWHAPLFKRARSHGLIAFSTPFDLTAVDFLMSLDVPCFKIASFECTHLPLLRAVAQTGKPVILSTGMASKAEIEEALTTLRESGCNDIVILKCTSTYPALPLNTNLRTIPEMRTTFGCEVGISDHTMGTGVSVAAVALGATVIEKHFTLRRADGGVDSAFSMEPHELKQLVDESERAWQALGTVSFGCTPAEEKSKQFRQSIFAAREIAAGETLTAENVRIVRPSAGLAPKHFATIVGRRAERPISKGTPIEWPLVSGPRPKE